MLNEFTCHTKRWLLDCVLVERSEHTEYSSTECGKFCGFETGHNADRSSDSSAENRASHWQHDALQLSSSNTHSRQLLFNLYSSNWLNLTTAMSSMHQYLENCSLVELNGWYAECDVDLSKLITSRLRSHTIILYTNSCLLTQSSWSSHRAMKDVKLTDTRNNIVYQFCLLVSSAALMQVWGMDINVASLVMLGLTLLIHWLRKCSAAQAILM